MSLIEYRYKIVLMGHYGVGKTSFANQYVSGNFNPQEESTIGAAYLTKKIEEENRKIKFDIWDTAGQERYRSLVSMYYRGSDVILILYDVTNKKSLSTARDWLNILQAEQIHPKVMALIGNKNEMETERVISYEEGCQLAKEKDILFFESSAKTGFNVERIFNELVKKLPQVKKDERLFDLKDKKGFCCGIF